MEYSFCLISYQMVTLCSINLKNIIVVTASFNISHAFSSINGIDVNPP